MPCNKNQKQSNTFKTCQEPTPCGCKCSPVYTDCLIYSGESLPPINAVQGDEMNALIKKLSDKIQNLTERIIQLEEA